MVKSIVCIESKRSVFKDLNCYIPHGRGRERRITGLEYFIEIYSNITRMMKRKRPLINILACLISVSDFYVTGVAFR